MSAYDMVLRDLLVNNLFHWKTDGQSLIYINNRLQNRSTFLEWDNRIVRPIDDQQGLEQGGARWSKEDILDHHHKETTEKLLQLLPALFHV